MTSREKGVASMACPSCSTELALSQQADGGLAAETCASCHPADAPKKSEKASVSSAPRERGTTLTNEKE